jgi:GrpB-like predicted nucleotidyltransferase (UPF0157 family)
MKHHNRIVVLFLYLQSMLARGRNLLTTARATKGSGRYWLKAPSARLMAAPPRPPSRTGVEFFGPRSVGEIAVQIEHVGSTSVPGLRAKPIIDILLIVPNSADESTYVPLLEAAGYRLVIREPEWYEHRVFKGPDTNINLPTVSAHCSEIDRMLLFRDWLRTHPDDRELYERAKVELAQRDWKYIQNYADAQSEVVEDIMQRARQGSPAPTEWNGLPLRMHTR